MIRLTNVTKVHRSDARTQRALNQVSLHIDDGEMVAVVGASGSGKTTLLNLLGGLDREFDGQADVAGHSLHELSDDGLAAFRQAHIGFVFQHFVLRPDLTCLQNVALPALFAKKHDRAVEIRAVKLLHAVGMHQLLLEHPHKMSGGQQQRVAIARALVMEPRLLLCDEPTGALDEETGLQIMQLLRHLQRVLGFSAVVVTHEDNVARFATRCIVMHDGAIKEQQQLAPAPEADVVELIDYDQAAALLSAAHQAQAARQRQALPRKLAGVVLQFIALIAAVPGAVVAAEQQAPTRYMLLAAVVLVTVALVSLGSKLRRPLLPPDDSSHEHDSDGTAAKK